MKYDSQNGGILLKCSNCKKLISKEDEHIIGSFHDMPVYGCHTKEEKVLTIIKNTKG